VRVAKRDRGKPLSMHDIDALAKFRAEMTVYSKLRAAGATHESATRAVFAEELRR
jgi:hypothetical protein